MTTETVEPNIIQKTIDIFAPFRAYRKMVMDLAAGKSVSAARRVEVLRRVCRTEQHLQGDIRRFCKLRDAAKAREERAKLEPKLAEAKQRQAALSDEFKTVYAKIKAEFDKQVAELRKPLAEVEAEVQTLDEAIKRGEAMQVNLYHIGDEALQQRAAQCGNDAVRLQAEAREIGRTIARIEAYRDELTAFRKPKLGEPLPDWHPARRVPNYDPKRIPHTLSEVDRAAALAWIEKQESRLDGLRARLASIPGEIAALEQQRLELAAKAIEPERWRLVEEPDEWL